jgi:hypothetical protein
VAPARKTNTDDKIIKDILESYHLTDGRQPVYTPADWGGHDLATTDWLRKFARAIASFDQSKNAWETVTKKCDASRIIEILYLYTNPKTCSAKESRKSHYAVAEEIDVILMEYEFLCEEIERVIHKPRVLETMRYAEIDLTEELHRLEEIKQRVQVLRDLYRALGSPKRKIRNWYLLLLDVEISGQTDADFAYATELADLINAAHAAHYVGREDKVPARTTDEWLVSKYIDRYKKFRPLLNAIRGRK